MKLRFAIVTIVALAVMMSVNALASVRCFTINGNAYDNNGDGYTIVNSMGTAWDSQTPFVQWGIVEGTTTTLTFCVSEETGGAMIIGDGHPYNTIYPLGGSGQPDVGYPRESGPFNSIHDGKLVLGDENENIQILFHPEYHPGSWQPTVTHDGTFTIVHSVYRDHNPDIVYNGNTIYDWVSRMYAQAWIVEVIAECPTGKFDYVGEGNGDWDNIDGPNWQPMAGGGWTCDMGEPEPTITLLPQNDCGPIDDDTCIGRYPLYQMGSFDANGNWTFNSDFLALMDNWGGIFPPSTHPQYWTPIKETGLITDGPWQNNDHFVHRRVYSDGRQFTLFGFQLQTGTAIKYPTVYLSQDPNCPDCGQWISVWYGPVEWPDFPGEVCQAQGDVHAQCDGTNPSMEADGDPYNDVSPDNPVLCCRPFADAMAYPHVDQIDTTELTEDRVNFVRWDNTNEVRYAPDSYDGGILNFFSYDLMSNGGNNMWSLKQHYGYGQTAPILRYHFPFTNLTGEQTFTINYDEDNKNDTLMINFTDIRDMPIVDPVITQINYVATQENKKSGKAVKMLAEEETVDNIKVREVVDPNNPDAGAALVVQWPEPDAILFGNIQLRVFVGEDVPVTPLNHQTYEFLWLDAPVHAGTVVFPQDVWMPYKEKMLLEGKTVQTVHLMYRINSDRYQNRSQSYRTFDIQP